MSLTVTWYFQAQATTEETAKSTEGGALGDAAKGAKGSDDAAKDAAVPGAAAVAGPPPPPQPCSLEAGNWFSVEICISVYGRLCFFSLSKNAMQPCKDLGLGSRATPPLWPSSSPGSLRFQ